MKAGKSDAEIDQLSVQIGSLMGQMTAVHTMAFAKFYALLTPDQRTKAQEMRDHMHERFMHRHGSAHGDGAGS